MPEGFSSIDAEIGWPAPESSRDLWDVVQVSFGHQTQWLLRLELAKGEATAEVVFRNPTTFRVQDEGQMVAYWVAREKEGWAPATFMTVAESPYLDEFKKEPTGSRGDLRHFLVVAMNTCVEILSEEAPIIVPDGAVLTGD